jgi:transcriptional regulator with XRE-family HTH domain/tetratricopeptide (TPR) repeat protein
MGIPARAVDASGRRARFGDLIRNRRIAAGLTQEELAERAGLGVRTISDIERGRIGRPHRRSVELLCDALGLAEPGREWTPYPPPGAPAASLADRAGSAGGQPLPAVPRQLPATIRNFAGRADELKVLDGLLDGVGGAAGTTLISAISGTAGVGKTALAVHWAHRASEHFPDGQFYVDLRGFDPSGAPAPPAEVIQGFLNAVGVPADQIPASPDAQAALYRSLLAGRRMLIILDNARDDAQVRPLLPGSSTCMVVVTSRRQLAGLAATECAQLLTLDVLSRAEAHEMLSRRLGPELLDGEPGAVGELITLCARLPLALAIAAARSAARPSRPLQALVEELRPAQSRLGLLDAADVADAVTSARAVLSWSYEGLTQPAARMFRLLAVHPGPDISAAAAASVAGVGPDDARQLLAELVLANLIAEHTDGRYACHDLLRAYAAEQASKSENDGDRSAAMRRMLDHYLHTAFGAAMLLDQIDPPPGPPAAVPGVGPEELADRSEAYAWFEAERPVLSAAISQAARHGFDGHAWHLSQVLREFYIRRAHWADSAATQQLAAAVADRAADQAAQATAHRCLGAALVRLGRHDEAAAHLDLALDLCRRLGDRQGEGRVLFQQAVMLGLQGDYPGALTCGRLARRLARACGEPADEGHALNAIGQFHARLGSQRLALACWDRALAIHRQTGTRLGEALTLQNLGVLRLDSGDCQQAIALLEQAALICAETGDRFCHADIVDDLGDAYHAAGDRAAAHQAWRQALAAFEDLQHPRAQQSRAKLPARRRTRHRSAS